MNTKKAIKKITAQPICRDIIQRESYAHTQDYGGVALSRRREGVSRSAFPGKRQLTLQFSASRCNCVQRHTNSWSAFNSTHRRNLCVYRPSEVLETW